MFHAALLLKMAIQIQTGCSSDFLQNSWSLLQAARYGQTEYEQAAFAMRHRPHPPDQQPSAIG